MEVVVYILIFFISLLIHLLGAISGGKGLILRPTLIFLGIPPIQVISSAVLTGTFTRLSKIYSFQKYKQIDWKLFWIYFPIASLAGIFAAILTVSISESLLKIIFGFVILLIGGILLFDKEIGIKNKKLHLSKKKKIMLLPLFFTTSFFGTLVGGMGSVLSFILMKYHGKTYISSSATKSVIHLSAIFASLYFIYSSTINWNLVLVLISSGIIGTYFGIEIGIKKGNTWIRKLTLIIIILSAIKLIFF
jgi:uncharacterized membrane protein YfcA